MSVFTSIGILIFSILAMASFQLIPGLFAILRHTLAGKFSKSRASDASLFFILGAEASILAVLVFCYFLFNSSVLLFELITENIFLWALAGILIAIAVLIFFFYFKKGPGTNLFISASLKDHLENRIRSIKTRSDAFTLGFVSIIPEFIFSFPLFVIATIAIINLSGSNAFSRAAFILIFALLSLFPLFIIHVSFSINTNLADFIKFRFKNKTFFRFFIPFVYIFMAILLIIGTLL